MQLGVRRGLDGERDAGMDCAGARRGEAYGLGCKVHRVFSNEEEYNLIHNFNPNPNPKAAYDALNAEMNSSYTTSRCEWMPELH
jgi:hypothetical protein